MRIEVRLQKLARQKAANENRDITMKTIAEETGLARNTVADYWYDRTLRLDKRVLETLCNYLACRFDELVVEVDDTSEVNSQKDFVSSLQVNN